MLTRSAKAQVRTSRARPDHQRGRLLAGGTGRLWTTLDGHQHQLTARVCPLRWLPCPCRPSPARPPAAPSARPASAAWCAAPRRSPSPRSVGGTDGDLTMRSGESGGAGGSGGLANRCQARRRGAAAMEHTAHIQRRSDGGWDSGGVAPPPPAISGSVPLAAGAVAAPLPRAGLGRGANAPLGRGDAALVINQGYTGHQEGVYAAGTLPHSSGQSRAAGWVGRMHGNGRQWAPHQRHPEQHAVPPCSRATGTAGWKWRGPGGMPV